MFLAFGVVCALLEAQRSGQGQVVDAAMVDGVGGADEHVLGVQEHRAVRRGAPRHQPARHRRALLRRLPMRRRRVHLDRLDRAAVLRRAAALDRPRRTTPSSPSRWTSRRGRTSRQRLAEVFATKTRDEWCALMEAHRRVLRAGADDERGGAASAQRGARHLRRGRRAPCSLRRRRGSRGRAAEIARPPAHPGQHSVEILRDWGFDAARIEALLASSAVVAG